MSYQLSESAQAAFGENDSEDAQKFLSILLSSMTEAVSSIRRSVIAIFLLAGVFELLVSSASIRSITIGSLSFSNTSLLQKAIPAIVTYLIYDTFALVNKYQNQATAYTTITSRFQPKLGESELLVLALPRIHGLWGFGVNPKVRYLRLEGTFSFAVSAMVTAVASLIFPLAFEVQAYYELVSKYGLQDAAIWISVTASIFFMAAWLIAIIFYIRKALA